jgi:hypothetical protein
MIQIISIEFEYRQKNYFALVRIKDKHPTAYHVTIMNGPLEQQLYGHHIFIEEDGKFIMDPVAEKDTGELRLAVCIGLCKHYKKTYHALEKKI